MTKLLASSDCSSSTSKQAPFGGAPQANPPVNNQHEIQFFGAVYIEGGGVRAIPLDNLLHLTSLLDKFVPHKILCCRSAVL